jgi:hypothetical protein
MTNAGPQLDRLRDQLTAGIPRFERRRSRNRRAAVAMACASVIGVAATASVVAQGDPGDDLETGGTDRVDVPVTSAPGTTPTTSTPTTSESTSSTSTSTTTVVDADADAAVAFIDAWRRGDAEAMRQNADAESVDVAMAFGTAEGDPECTSHQGGQYQCVVGVSSGTRMYILVGEPGASSGRVWWVSEYVPGT